MTEIFKHGLLSGIGSSERREAILAVTKGLKSLVKEFENDPFYKNPENRRAVETVVSLLISTFLTAEIKDEEAALSDDSGERLPGADITFPTKEVHYGRNQYMPLDRLPQTPEEADKLAWDDSVAADCHQFTSVDKKNVKYVSPDGRSEVIFTSEGDVVTAPEDYGTYNFSDPNTNPVGHFNKDVLPWIIWGNEEADSTDMNARLKAFVVDGGLHAIKKKENQ